MENSAAWIPVLAPLISLVADHESPDDVLNDFMAVGFNFQLPPELQDRFGPRKRAYLTEVQEWVDELEWTEQWELARALAIRLREKQPHQLNQRLEAVGWRFEAKTFIPIQEGETGKHVFFPAGAVHDAFVHIRGLFKQAESELFIVDAYVDSSIFRFLLCTNGPKTCRILTLTRSLPADFFHEAELFVRQHGFVLSVRGSDDFHDRQIVVDGTRAFVLGASIKDAGKRAFNIIPVENPAVAKEMISYAEKVWAAAAAIM